MHELNIWSIFFYGVDLSARCLNHPINGLEDTRESEYSK